MTAITISREFASGGETIARQVALALGYHFVDKEFIIVPWDAIHLFDLVINGCGIL